MTTADILTAPATSTALAFVLTSVGSLVAYLLRPRVRMLWAQGIVFSHRMHPNTDKEFLVNTATYFVINRGRMSAESVEFVLNFKVDEISVWPQRQYSVELNPEGRQIIRFDSFAPKEISTIHIINIAKPLPDVLNVRNAENIGRKIEIYPQQKFPGYVTVGIWITLIFGVFFIGRELIAFILKIISLVWT